MATASHGDRVWQVAVDHTGSYIASASDNKTSCVWNTQLELLHEFSGVHQKSVRSVAWRTNTAEPTLATGSFDATVGIFVLEKPKWEFVAQLEGHENEVKRIAWSRHGNYLASCSRDKSVWIWEVDQDCEDFECVGVCMEHTQDVKHVVWHPYSDLLASTSYDETTRLWRQDDDEWVCVADLQGHDATVWACDFEPREDTMRLVTVSADKTCLIWGKVGSSGGREGEQLPSVARWDTLVEEWECECKLPEIHTDAVYAVRWSPAGLVATCGADGRVVVYAPDPWRIVHVIEKAHGVFEVNSVDWLGTRLVTGGDDGQVKIWNIPENLR